MEYYEKSQRWTLVAGLGVVIMYLFYLIMVYAFTDSYPAAHLNNLYVIILSFVVISYVLRENRRSKIIASAHDLGFFAYITFPFFIPYYLYKTRRTMGVIVLIGLVVLMFLKPIVYSIWSKLP